MKTLFLLLFTGVLTFAQNEFCQSNWTSLESPGGGDINKIFKVTDSIFLAGVQNGSIYRSSNHGENWIKVFQGTNTYGNKGVESIVFNSYQEILVGTFINGILRSTNQGITWLNTNCGGGENMVNTQSGFMLSSDNVMAGWSLAKSLDSGKTWIPISKPNPWWYIYAMASINDIIFGAIGNGIVVTVDSGTTWQNYGNLFSSNVRINSILPLTEDEIMLGTNYGVYYTSNHGIDWQYRSNGIVEDSHKIYQLQNEAGVIFASGSSGLYYSVDLGLQWYHYNNYTYQHLIYSCVISDDLILAATENGIYKINPNMWINSSTGIYELTPITINSAKNNDLIYNTSSALFRSLDRGNSWSVVEFENFYDGCTFICKDSLYFVQNTDYLFFLSTDYGNNWINSGSYWGYSTSMSFSKDNNDIFSGFVNYDPQPPPSIGFRQSTDFGISWLQRADVGIVGLFYRTITTPGFIYTYVVDIYYYNGFLGVYRSSNDGISWSETNTGLTSQEIKYLTYDKNFDLYTSINNGIYCLDKNNYTWHPITTNYNNVTFMNFDKFNNIIIINDGKIYTSVDGNKWEYASSGLESQNLQMVETDSSGYFYVADDNGRLYKTITPYLINQLPTVPILVSPFKNQQVSPDTVNFVWESSSPLVMKYSVSISTDSLFNISIDTLVTDTSFSIFNLSSNQNYYWKVKAYNEVGWSDFSNVGTFTTNILKTIETKNTIKEFSLSRNYPNPFNPTTHFSYSIPAAGFVILKVYDVLGNEIAALVNEEKPAGGYNINFDGSNLASGIYFYVLRGGNFVQSRKMLLLK